MKELSTAIDPVLIEFIQREFGNPTDGDPNASLTKIYDALFVHGRSLAEVRAEFVKRLEAGEGSGSMPESAEVLSIDIRFQCGSCPQRIQLDARSQGATLNCPGCSAAMSAPLLVDALHSLSTAEAINARFSFEQMERELAELESRTVPGGSAPPAAGTCGKILSIEFRLRCPSCEATAKVDARFHGMSVHCPVCNVMFRLATWREALLSVFGNDQIETPAAFLSLLTSEEREFLSGTQSPQKKWWHRSGT